MENEETGLTAYRRRVATEKRNALLDAAIELFLSNGYAETTLDEVAKDAQVSSATLYKHFPTKPALFGGIMSRLWENDEGQAPVSPEVGNPSAGLCQIGREYASLLSKDRTVALFRVVIAEAPRFPELGLELYERGKKPYLDRLEKYLTREVEDGNLEIENLSLANRQFLGMINDVVFWPRLLIVDLMLSDTEIGGAVSSAVDTFMSRYAGRPG